MLIVLVGNVPMLAGVNAVAKTGERPSTTSGHRHPNQPSFLCRLLHTQ